MKLSLPIVQDGEELRGGTSASFERIARTCTPRTPLHAGYLRVLEALAQSAVRAATPPSVAAALLPLLAEVRAAANAQSTARESQAARHRAFDLVSFAEETAVDAVRNSERRRRAEVSTSLHRHSFEIVDRYVSLAAHFAVSAVCHALDAVSKPEVGLEVPVARTAALAWLDTALGAARSPEFVDRALAQATWDAARPTSQRLGFTAELLAPQIFHEFLGARFRARAALESAQGEAFVEWALSATSSLR